MSCRKGIGYLRYSDKKQDGNHSIEGQMSRLLRTAEQYDFSIERWIVDAAVSAYRRPTDKRPGTQELLEAAMSPEVEGIFFDEESRIDRQTSDFVINVYHPITEAKPDLRFYSAASGLWNPHTIQAQMQLVFAQSDSDMKAKRARDSQSVKLEHKRGPKRPGSRVPYGCTMEDGILVPNEHASVVYFIFYLASWGYSDRRIAEILTASGVPSPEQGSWSASTIDVIVNNPAYLGDLAWGRRKSRTNSARRADGEFLIFGNLFVSIIPQYLWGMVHDLRKLKNETGIKMDTDHVLQGIAYCQSCSVPLKVKDSSPAGSKKRYVTYRCPACKGKVEATMFQNEVLDRVAREWGSFAPMFRKQAVKALATWKSTLTKRSNQIRQEIENCMYRQSLLSDTTVHLQEWKDVLQTQLSKLRDDQIEIQQLLDKVENLKQCELDRILERFMIGDWRELLSPIERRTFLLMTVDKVMVEFGCSARVSLIYRTSPIPGLTEQIGRFAEER